MQIFHIIKKIYFNKSIEKKMKKLIFIFFRFYMNIFLLYQINKLIFKISIL